tara:strand:+ start:685 stop:1056 length:372 start_codon:yes stop_codon:yes gene_type:complete
MTRWFRLAIEDEVGLITDQDPGDAFRHKWLVTDNDNIQVGWFYDEASNTVSSSKSLDISQIRSKRDELLANSDWMVLEDSPYQASGQESNLAAIKTYRQELRDFPDESVSYTTNTPFPTLTLS